MPGMNCSIWVGLTQQKLNFPVNKMTTSVREEKIREIAYQLWVDEGKPAGRDVEHYHRAVEIFEESRNEQAGPVSEDTAIPEGKTSTPKSKQATPKGKTAAAKKGSARSTAKRSTAAKKATTAKKSASSANKARKTG